MRKPSDVFSRVTTDRLIIRVLGESDVNDTYLSWFEDAAVIANIKAAKTQQTLCLLRTFVREKLESSSALLLGIFARDSSAHIGNLKFEPIDTSSGTAVVGVLIGNPAWRNRGVFREAFHSAAERLYSIARLHTYWLGVSLDNQAAIGAYRKAGFIERDHPPQALIPTIAPHVLYMSYKFCDRGESSRRQH
jgi:RimJ/RimL family protein N-acetyltransferase